MSALDTDLTTGRSTDLDDAVAVAVCSLADLDPERGAAALVHGRQVALFHLADGSLACIDHRDPASGANVLARGLLGTVASTDDADAEWYVASPLHKHRFVLADGRCLDDERLSVAVHDVVAVDGVVMVTIRSSS